MSHMKSVYLVIKKDYDWYDNGEKIVSDVFVTDLATFSSKVEAEKLASIYNNSEIKELQLYDTIDEYWEN